ncbi:MAG: tRNA-modifying protein YgfZ [Alteromonadaceae bacterium]|nr:tRNA-modifying protein YgfZ [Alteromonadaceae bacterium]
MALTIENKLPAVNELADNYLIQVNNLSAINLSGEDQVSYLQGQVTCDVTQLTENSLLNGAHCDAKGKMFAIFRLFKRNDALWLLQPQATLATSLAALQKFGVFAKVTIQQAENFAAYALVGTQAEQRLKQQFKQIPDSMTPVVQLGNTTLIYIANDNSQQKQPEKTQQRYLLIDTVENIEKITANFILPIFKSDLWDLQEILTGFPLMNENIIGEYVPQMLNVQAINGISFTKGCYLGQETVARMQYLGRNKRALFILSGELKAPLTDNTIIELQLGENWRRAGKVLSYYQADNGQTYLQAVLASDINDESTLRLKVNDKQHAQLSINAQPYSLQPKD